MLFCVVLAPFCYVRSCSVYVCSVACCCVVLFNCDVSVQVCSVLLKLWCDVV